jgi:hypothetical protein
MQAGSINRSWVTRTIRGGVWLALCGSAGFAHSADWRDRRIDGNSEARFELSIAALQNSLPPRRREDFDIALAVIWMSESLGSAGLDLDGDGDVDRADTRRLVDSTMDLLTDIQRGDLLSSIDKRATNNGGGYAAANFLQQLDGMTCEEVLDLAGRPARVSAAALRRAEARRRQRQNFGNDLGIESFRRLIHGGVTSPGRW